MITAVAFAAWNMFTAAMLFINVHHYFIDTVLWRFKDPEVLGAVSASRARARCS